MFKLFFVPCLRGKWVPKLPQTYLKPPTIWTLEKLQKSRGCRALRNVTWAQTLNGDVLTVLAGLIYYSHPRKSVQVHFQISNTERPQDLTKSVQSQFYVSEVVGCACFRSAFWSPFLTGILVIWPSLIPKSIMKTTVSSWLFAQFCILYMFASISF